MARTGKHQWLHPGRKILPTRISNCSNTNCDHRCRYEDNNIAFTHVQPHYYSVRPVEPWAFKLLALCLHNNSNNNEQQQQIQWHRAFIWCDYGAPYSAQEYRGLIRLYSGATASGLRRLSICSYNLYVGSPPVMRVSFWGYPFYEFLVNRRHVQPTFPLMILCMLFISEGSLSSVLWMALSCWGVG